MMHVSCAVKHIDGYLTGNEGFSMLGKTHVMSSLAVGHAGFIGLTFYQQTNDIPVMAVHGVTHSALLTPFSYGAVVLMTLLFGLLLFKVGPKQMYILYLSGVVALLLGLSLFGGGTSLTVALCSLSFTIGALMPDIDEERSTLGRYVPLISQNIPHRTITHTIWIVLLLIGASWYFGSVLLLAFGIGYTLHIIEDYFSNQSICWFYPIIGSYETFGSGAVMKRGRRPRFTYKTGGAAENAIFYGSFAVHVVSITLAYSFIL